MVTILLKRQLAMVAIDVNVSQLLNDAKSS